ncbi:MAG: prolyl oligopeptidase family serine peptidase [Alistipes shahii]
MTKGDWEVTDVAGTDGKRVWYLSTETSPLRRNLYSVRLDGTQKRRLTTGEGFYTIAPSAGMKYYIIDLFQRRDPQPGHGGLRRRRATRSALLADSQGRLRDELAAANRPQKEFFTFATERGDTLNAYIVKPRGFDPSHRYPVLLTQYSGPGSQSVRDRWSLDWEDALADKGYIVVCADGRGTGFRGEKFKKQTYGRLGALEVEDQLSTARHMAAQPWVDPARIGIYGWSYGGFMALSCAMKGHGLFKMAIAVAPVTSWRYYDTIYTEIYNNLPQYNAAGYDDNSPINFARMLDDRRTRLLIIHGTADDNVHFQNTVEMTRALNRCGKQYDMMVYPDQNHSMLPDDTAHMRQKDDPLHAGQPLRRRRYERMLIETPVGPRRRSRLRTRPSRSIRLRHAKFRNRADRCTSPKTAAEPAPCCCKRQRELAEYFAGTRREFSLPLAPAGTLRSSNPSGRPLQNHPLRRNPHLRPYRRADRPRRIVPRASAWPTTATRSPSSFPATAWSRTGVLIG